MIKFAILFGSAPAGFCQKKINEMKKSLASKNKGSWSEGGIISFPNGASEKTLKIVFENIKTQAENLRDEKSGYENLKNTISLPFNNDISEEFSEIIKIKIFLYICTLSPFSESEKSVWLGGEEVKKSVIDDFCKSLRFIGGAESCGAGASVEPAETCDIQVIYDSCREFVKEDDEADA